MSRTFLVHADCSVQFQDGHEWLGDISVVYSNCNEYDLHEEGFWFHLRQQHKMITRFHNELIDDIFLALPYNHHNSFLKDLKRDTNSKSMLLYLRLVDSPCILLHQLIADAVKLNIYVVVETHTFYPLSNHFIRQFDAIVASGSKFDHVRSILDFVTPKLPLKLMEWVRSGDNYLLNTDFIDTENIDFCIDWSKIDILI